MELDPVLLSWRMLRRDDDTGDTDDPNSSGADELLKLLKDPFKGALAVTSVYTAFVYSIVGLVVVCILFSLFRPYHQSFYAPRLKHADEKHAPPPIGKKPWAWISPVITTKEQALMQQLGMDATIFLRFINMCRNMFLVLTVLGCGVLIPLNYTKSITFSGGSNDEKELQNHWIIQITPENVWASSAIWGQVVVAWLFDIIICGFLWWNYRKVLALRRTFFASEEYQSSLHSRTLMLFDLPKQGRSDEGIARIIDQVVPNSSFARTAVARNVKDLPDLIKQHEKTVRNLEEVLAKYLRNPGKLPAERPKCKVSKKDRTYDTLSRNQKVDAIDYYTQRIRDLEVEIKAVRASVDKRGTMPYGFASYSDIVEAHNIAYACRNTKPQGASIKLAPRPNDIIWTNMPLSSSARSRKRWINTFWVTILTFLWIAPNAMIAIFLVNLPNLGRVWPAFQRSLDAHTTFWGIVQGIVAPALTSGVYVLLPIIFRRLSQQAGDQTKTGRERHVLAKLFNFFVFNNLIVFTFFSVVWTFIAGVLNRTKHGENAWNAIVKQNIASGTFTTLCNNSPFWITYLLQRQLGAAVDLAQLWPLILSFFSKRFSSPTPRDLIELTAPPPFEYASYYNYFLFYATVTLCYAGYQPLVLVATSLYFTVDSYLKKYLLLYRFVTKTESGGLFWRVLINRFIFATMLSNLAVLLICWVRGNGNHIQFFAVCPLPLLMLAFKFYCRRAFDDKIQYFSTHNLNKHPEGNMGKENGGRSERLAARFGHPALYKPLITPMVHQRAQNMLPAVYKGRLTDGRDADTGDMMTISGYSDMYALDAMQGGKLGKSANGIPGFEYVSENHMDFEYFKNRAEFAEGHGGGEIYGIQGEIMRPGTPGSFGDDLTTRPGSPSGSGRSTPFGPPRRQYTGMSETGYGNTQPPLPPMEMPPRNATFYNQDNSSASALVYNAAAPPMATPSGQHSREASADRVPGRRTPGYPAGYEQIYNSPPARSVAPGYAQRRNHSPGPSMGALGGGPQGYSNLAQMDGENDDVGSYDYFRGGRATRKPGEGW